MKNSELSNVLVFSERNTWRNWLSKYHDKKREAWILIQKKGSLLSGIPYDVAVEEAVSFGWIDGKMRSVDNYTYTLRFSPRKTGSIWSKLNRERAEKLIKSKKMSEAGLVKIEEAKKNGNWDAAYSSKVKPTLSQDLKKALENVPEAWMNFNKFSNSHQNIYVNWVETAKREETRVKRIREVVNRAVKNVKPGI